MIIEATPSGDFKVTSDYPSNVFDIARVADRIYFEHLRFVREWPVLTEYDMETGLFELWFIAPELDHSYLDHEDLF